MKPRRGADTPRFRLPRLSGRELMRKEQLHYYSFNTKTAMLLLVDTPVEDADMRV